MSLAALSGLSPEKLALLDDDELIFLEELIASRHRDEDFARAKGDFVHFSKYINPKHSYDGFYAVYYHILDLFAKGKIRRLIVTCPPQHGKSSGSTQLLPAYLFGINPDIKIAISSYSADLAKDFNKDIQNIIDSTDYNAIFPATTLSGNDFSDRNIKGYDRTKTKFDIVNHKGVLHAIGRGGGLTGKSIDISIMDDLYKNYEEANSPVVRLEAENFYKSVIKTRRPKQELIVFTRWNEDDLIGYIETKYKVITVESFEDLENIPDKAWIKINFEALKESFPTEIDPRETGEALAPFLMDAESLLEEKGLDAENFNCMYQGNPMSKIGRMYGDFRTYEHLPELSIKKAYVDTADTGKDYLCSIVYGLPTDWGSSDFYILDVIYTQKSMEITEPMVIEQMNNNAVAEADVESNNGGRGFGRAIEDKIWASMTMFYQGANKESRITTNRTKITQHAVFPSDWATRWPEFYNSMTRFKRNFGANKFNDAQDCITGCWEKSQEGFRVEDIEIEND